MNNAEKRTSLRTVGMVLIMLAFGLSRVLHQADVDGFGIPLGWVVPPILFFSGIRLRWKYSGKNTSPLDEK